MPITADIVITPPPLAGAVQPPQPRPVIAPATDRESAQNNRRDSSRNPNGPLSFRAALSSATFGGLARAATPFEAAGQATGGDQPTARPPRLPDTTPVELSGAEASDLFTRAVANNQRKGDPAHAAAASRYSASYFAGSTFQARPGETLELTA